MRANVICCWASLRLALLAAVRPARSTADRAQPCRGLADPCSSSARERLLFFTGRAISLAEKLA